VQAIHRTLRYADEANSAILPASWDARVSLFVEGSAKNWSVEVTAADLLKKESSDRFGIVLSYRF
jgi:hypothetical protein